MIPKESVNGYGTINGTCINPSNKDASDSSLKLAKSTIFLCVIPIIILIVTIQTNRPSVLQEQEIAHFSAVLLDHEVHRPFSTVDPVSSLKLYPFERPKSSSPGTVFGKLQNGESGNGESGKYALPTNQWYENMLLLPDAMDPGETHHVYSLPYVVDAAGPIPGIRLSITHILAFEKVVQASYIAGQALTLGASTNLDSDQIDLSKESMHKRYSLFGDSPLSSLGLTLQWDPLQTNNQLQMMTSSIIRGMPYGTVHYHYKSSETPFIATAPTVVSELMMNTPPIGDAKNKIICQARGKDNGKLQRVEKSVLLNFFQSDFSWLVFYSHPVYVKCYEAQGEKPFMLQVVALAETSALPVEQSLVFTSRIALLNNCTTGTNPSHCDQNKPHDRSDFNDLLHKHADVYPGSNSNIQFAFASDATDSHTNLKFNWDAQSMKGDIDQRNEDQAKGLLMYSLPHHREVLRSYPNSSSSLIFDSKQFCTPGLNGQLCIVEGSTWTMKEDLDARPSFFAPRPPLGVAIPNLAKAINTDINFRVPEYYTRGVGDTYFSGKILAKLARILLITQELTDLCSMAGKPGFDGPQECNHVTLPSQTEFDNTLDHLRSATEIWINGTAESPFVYDKEWGGIVSCGCYFNDKTQKCDNVYPDCPSFSDPGLDFGHGFYNDHHFHHGYHIYAAAVVSLYDNEWGKENFERVLLLIRDIANPSQNDNFFPAFRMKDWYQGNSWAGGISACYPNGRNQESSSESIAAYEAVSLFGEVMAGVWERAGNTAVYKEKALAAHHISNVGQLLTATEIRAADRYWHVRHSGPKTGIYPKQYKPLVVGIMWNMMVQFQTWFGGAPHLAYGIQLMPLTPISEKRDDVEWLKELYPSFAESCRMASNCDEEGWGILQHAVLASVGHPIAAIEYAESLNPDAFETAGGNGHSLTNTIWYYATRPSSDPLPLTEESSFPLKPLPLATNSILIDCGCPKTCTKKVLDSPAGDYTCGDRIVWLVNNDGKSQIDACNQIAGEEFNDSCTDCDPNLCTSPVISKTEEEDLVCPKCSKRVCKDTSTDKCPNEAPYLCIYGVNKGGCSVLPWVLGTSGGSNCNKCCRQDSNC